MKLLKLKLKNFKGIKSFSLDIQGEDVNIYGDNATGKTTIFDAFTWLLFDKDSQNKKDFEIKTLDESGRPIHGLDHEVEATLQLADGKQITLRKVFHEKWTKKRGSAKPTFTGHTTDYFIDGVPVKKSEYAAKIDEIVDENIFKLLTSPTYFNEQLHWRERRRILLDICGDISDEEVITSDPALAKLPEILQGRKLEDHRKVIAARRAEINKELERIPVRIDEVQRNLPDISDINPEEITQNISTLKEAVKEKEQQIVRIEGGGEIAEKTKALREIEGQLLEIKNQYRSHYEAKIQEKQEQLSATQERYLELQGSIKNLERTLQSNNDSLQNLQERIEKLREKWYQINSQEFSFEQSDTCPTCGQPLPEEKLAEAREKALADFNREKAEKLEGISAEGKRLRAQADDLATENVEIEKQLGEVQARLQLAKKSIANLKAQIEDLRKGMDSYSNDPAYIKKLQEKQELEAAIAALKEGCHKETIKIQAEIVELENQIRAAESRLADVQRYEQGQKRIKELKAQEKELAREYEKLEEELYLTEQFIRTKVNILEEKINSRFKLARFKLFDVQVNGALVETCETLYKGVPYSSLNNAARINIGLDIINTLAEHYNFTAPIFIDNAEAVTELIKTKGQMIKLIVSGPDKVLRVEHTEKTKMKEAV